MRILLLLCLAFFAVANSFAQSGLGAIKVYVKCGRIGNDGCVVADAKTILRPIENWSKSTEDIVGKTDKDGYFSQTVSFGEYKLIISANGYKTYQTTVYIPSSKNLEWAIRLHKVKTSKVLLFGMDILTNHTSEFFK